MGKWILSFVLALSTSLSGCQAIQSGDGRATLLIQYSTVKLIEESETVTPSNVLSTIERIRLVLNEDEKVILSNLKREVMSTIDWSELEVSDRLIINAVVNEVEHILRQRYMADESDKRVENTVIRIRRFLDLVEQAAILSR